MCFAVPPISVTNKVTRKLQTFSLGRLTFNPDPTNSMGSKISPKLNHQKMDMLPGQQFTEIGMRYVFSLGFCFYDDSRSISVYFQEASIIKHTYLSSTSRTRYKQKHKNKSKET